MILLTYHHHCELSFDIFQIDNNSSLQILMDKPFENIHVVYDHYIRIIK